MKGPREQAVAALRDLTAAGGMPDDFLASVAEVAVLMAKAYIRASQAPEGFALIVTSIGLQGGSIETETVAALSDVGAMALAKVLANEGLGETVQ
jgi:hypothetical protein